MALKVKDAAMAAKKFASRGAAAAGDYKEGVRAAGELWAQNTAASVENYTAGVQEAITRNAFSKGVAAAGASKFADKASTTGAQRFPQGVASAEGDWARGTAPYLDALKNLTLPPRAPRGDPRNFARSQAVAEALRRRKVAG